MREHINKNMVTSINNALIGVNNGISDFIGEAENFIGDNTAAVVGGVAAAGLVAGAVALGVASSKKGNTRKSKSKIKHTSRGWKQDRKRHSKQKWEVAYRKRKAKKARSKHHKSKSKKGIHYTKNGQPYKILASGKARFIKKK
jgi:hypothetical protein